MDSNNYQLPPTPTPYATPIDNEIIEVPDVSLWDSAPDAVGFWNTVPGEATVLFQVLIIIGIANAMAFNLIRKLKSVTTSKE